MEMNIFLPIHSARLGLGNTFTRCLPLTNIWHADAARFTCALTEEFSITALTAELPEATFSILATQFTISNAPVGMRRR
jgi:hypothetical protein